MNKSLLYLLYGIGALALIVMIVISFWEPFSIGSSSRTVNIIDPSKNSTPEEPAINTTDWKTEQSKGVGLEMRIPSTWVMDQDRDGAEWVSPIPGSFNLKMRGFWDPATVIPFGAKVSLSISSFQMNNNDPLRDFVDKEKDEDIGEESKVSKVEETSLAGLPAIRYVIDSLDYFEPNIILEVVAKDGNRYYEVEAMADSQELLDENLPIFEEMIKSIRVL